MSTYSFQEVLSDLSISSTHLFILLDKNVIPSHLSRSGELYILEEDLLSYKEKARLIQIKDFGKSFEDLENEIINSM